MKISQIREIVQNARWTRADLTGGTSTEFRKQNVGPILTEKVVVLRALDIAPRFKSDIERRDEEITLCERVIARWHNARLIHAAREAEREPDCGDAAEWDSPGVRR